MIIYSLKGAILYQSSKRTLKAALEEAAGNGIVLRNADLRRARLVRARLDGLKAPGACFWGSVLDGADMAGADLRGCDLRNTDLKNTCLAESNCQKADFSGAIFGNTILRQCDVRLAVFSSPALFDCDLGEIKNIEKALYRHKGEIDLPIVRNPFVLKGLSRDIVVLGNVILWGDSLVMPGHMPCGFTADYFTLKTTIDGFR